MNTRKRRREPTLVGTGLINNRNIAIFIDRYAHHPKYLPPELIGHSISNWDVSAVTVMAGLFVNSEINEPLNNWDVSNVTDMSFMFNGSRYNHPLDKWDVTNVKVFSGMFLASKFNHPLNNWNVSEAKDMANMFERSEYNHPLNNWNVSNVTTMVSLFKESQYNHPLDNWNVSTVRNMSNMFNLSIFNHPLGNWNVSNVNYMSFMFKDSQYNHPLEQWKVSKVVTTAQMFMNCPYNHPLDNWIFVNVKDMSFMFFQSAYNHPLENWNVSTVKNMSNMFYQSPYNHPLERWNVSNVTDMTHMFEESKYNHPLEKWNVSNVKDMSHMFEESQYNHPLEKWTPNRGTIIESMFDGCPLNPLPSWYDDDSNTKSRRDSNDDISTNNNVVVSNTSSGKKNTYKDLFHDLVYEKFDQLMAPFQSNPKQIESPQFYITDQILANVQNPYLVHYETLPNGAIYPIITIPKGTMLFTGRTNVSTTMTNSYAHLFKIKNNQTLDSYSANDFENTLTYFFPFPYLSNIIDKFFKTLDMVVLTKDVRLLCLVSPSPLERGYKDANNKKLYNNFEPGDTMVTTCQNRIYDLCINKQLIMDLKLNGYIGIASEDSVSTHLDKLSKSPLEKLFSLIPQTKTALDDACCFNNAIYPPKRSYHELTFLKEMKTTRTFGVPEIVLIPYDIHTYPDPREYITCRQAFEYKSFENNPHFIFRHEHHVTDLNSIDISKKMEKVLAKSYPLGTVIGKSLIAPTLMTVLLSEVDADKREYVTTNQTVTLDELSFANSYLPNPTSKCALELMAYYNQLQPSGTNSGTTIGGRRVLQKTQRRLSPSRLTKKTRTRPVRVRIYQQRKPNVLVDTPTAYYSEVNGIPIVAI